MTPGFAEDRLDLACEPSAVHHAKGHARSVLTAWGLSEGVVGDGLLIVSELLSNAVKHARPASAWCGLLLRCTDEEVTVAVYDVDNRPPVLRAAAPDAECGRGLLLVDSISHAWGYTPASPVGKLVWARLPIRVFPAAQSENARTGAPALAVNKP